jgi:hypothetical protein
VDLQRKVLAAQNEVGFAQILPTGQFVRDVFADAKIDAQASARSQCFSD